MAVLLAAGTSVNTYMRLISFHARFVYYEKLISGTALICTDPSFPSVTAMKSSSLHVMAFQARVNENQLKKLCLSILASTGKLKHATEMCVRSDLPDSRDPKERERTRPSRTK